MSRRLLTGIIVGVIVILVSVLGYIFRTQLFTQAVPNASIDENSWLTDSDQPQSFQSPSYQGGAIQPIVGVNDLLLQQVRSVFEVALNHIYDALVLWRDQYEAALTKSFNDASTAVESCQDGGNDTACYTKAQQAIADYEATVQGGVSNVANILNMIAEAANNAHSETLCSAVDCPTILSVLNAYRQAAAYYGDVVTKAETRIAPLRVSLDSKKQSSATPSSLSPSSSDATGVQILGQPSTGSVILTDLGGQQSQTFTPTVVSGGTSSGAAPSLGSSSTPSTGAALSPSSTTPAQSSQTSTSQTSQTSPSTTQSSSTGTQATQTSQATSTGGASSTVVASQQGTSTSTAGISSSNGDSLAKSGADAPSVFIAFTILFCVILGFGALRFKRH